MRDFRLLALGFASGSALAWLWVRGWEYGLLNALLWGATWLIAEGVAFLARHLRGER